LTDVRQSTFACRGGPNDPDFFSNDIQDPVLGNEASSKNSPMRRFTLFNIFSFSDDVSLRHSSPELTLDDVSFSQFWAEYESLI